MNKEKIRQFHLNMLSGIGISIVNILFVLGSYPIYIYYLGYEQYGLWLVLSSLIQLIKIADFGMGQSLIKMIAEERGKDNRSTVEALVVVSICFLFAVGCSIAFLMVQLSSSLLDLFLVESTYREQAISLLPYIATLCSYGLVNEALLSIVSGLGRLDVANGLQIVGKILNIVVSVTFLALGWGVKGLVYGFAANYLFVYIFSSFIIRRWVGIRFLRKENYSLSYLKALLRLGFSIFGGSMVAQLLTPFCRMMIANYGGIGMVPLFDIAYRGAMQMRSVLESVLKAFISEVSWLMSRHEPENHGKVSKAYYQAMKWIVCGALPLYLIIALMITPILKIWLQGAYLTSMPILFQFSLAASFLSLLGVPSFYLSLGMGNIRVCNVNHLINTLGVITMSFGYLFFYGTLSPLTIVQLMLIAFTVSFFYLSWSVRKLLRRGV